MAIRDKPTAVSYFVEFKEQRCLELTGPVFKSTSVITWRHSQRGGPRDSVGGPPVPHPGFSQPQLFHFDLFYMQAYLISLGFAFLCFADPFFFFTN